MMKDRSMLYYCCYFIGDPTVLSDGQNVTCPGENLIFCTLLSSMHIRSVWNYFMNESVPLTADAGAMDRLIKLRRVRIGGGETIYSLLVVTFPELNCVVIECTDMSAFNYEAIVEVPTGKRYSA